MQGLKANKPIGHGKINRAGKSFFQSPGDSYQTKPFFPVTIRQHLQVIQPIVQLKPSYLVSHNFMGRSAEVNPEMQTRLQAVEAELQLQYDFLPPLFRPSTLADFAGLTSIRGWRENSGTSFHASGSAVDVNYRNQPYIATRTTAGTTPPVFGGERDGSTTATRALRQLAVDVYDHASQFTNTIPYGQIANALSAVVPGYTPDPQAITNLANADVNERRTSETTSSIYRRFRATSDALAAYLALAFQTNYDSVFRAPVANIQTATEAQLLAAIPLTERKDEAAGIADITAFMINPLWQSAHPGFTKTAREIYFDILRDYEQVRIPMVRGNPSISPAQTRNPALGFLHMPQHFVVAMADVGRLRWGAADLGPRESGDVHHFDLGTHAGFVPDETP